MYIIQRMDQDGGYVSRPGSRSSYVRDPLKARRWESREDAEGNRCPENERVVDLNTIIDNYGE